MNHGLDLIFIPIAIATLTTCDESRKDPEDLVGTARSEIHVEAHKLQGALNPNSLPPAALTIPGLDLAVLAASPLAQDSIAPKLLSTLKAHGSVGALSKQFLRYLAGCALEEGQSLDLSWIHGKGLFHESYEGELGLASEWRTRPLSPIEQRWVTACLLSRTNWYGVTVMISSRGAHEQFDTPSSEELTTFPNEEGAFWGNLFAPTPTAYACYYAPHRAYSRSLMRVCAAGHLTKNGSVEECGALNILGSCDALCEPLDPQGAYHPACSNAPGDMLSRTTEVVSVFLP